MKKFDDYFLGFDIGTNSVGWAVTDTNYKVLKFNGKSMWGVHLFEEGKTAQERRMFRASKRRRDREKQRLTLLRELFEKEILKKDKLFFQRLEDSKFFEEDKKEKQKNTLFNDKDFKDKDYHNLYPTIHHLRSELINNKGEHDIRLVYLAINNILKNRGHFLFEGQDFNSATSFDNVFNTMINTLNDYGIEFDYFDSKKIEELIKNKEITINDKKKKLAEYMNVEKDKQKKAITDLLAGGKVSLSSLFDDETLMDSEIEKISFSEGIENSVDKLEDALQDKIYLIYVIKSVYDWSILVNILNNKKYLSDAKIQIYERHKKDLNLLKKMIKEYLTDKDYQEILKSGNIKNNYSSYIGKDFLGNSRDIEKKSSQEDFCKFLVKKFEKINLKRDEEIELYEKIKQNKAFPKQISKDNGVIPYQLHLYELEAILKNAEIYLPFLRDVDEYNLSVSDKIKSILTFRIPYYVGPLNPHSQFAWIERKKEGKIYPWNFDDIVDKQKSADKFILRMTNKCTYLKNEDVLAKNSILYSKYNILNQLNNLGINGEKISVNLKQKIFEDLFLNIDRPKKVTIKRIREYINSKEGIELKDEDINGIDKEIVGDLKPLIDFRNIFGEDISEEEIDDIIQKIVILGESKDLLKEYLNRQYKDRFTNEQINKVSKLKYSGWGRFSKKFLTEIYHTDTQTGECISIMTALMNTNKNLMQLLSKNFQYLDNIEKENQKNNTNETMKEMIEQLYASPAVKRSIGRVMAIAKEIVKITKHSPQKIFIEMAREVDDLSKKGKRTTSRKEALEELYKKCKIDEEELLKELEKADIGELRDNRLYLYYMQMGKCMYSGERINLSEIYTAYDVDHIYPQSKVKDDSITANKVLVKRELNSKKEDIYPIPNSIISDRARELWKILLEKGFITKEKYFRLTRTTQFTDEELSGFIARQLVETRQSTKAIAEILQKIYKDSTIVYVKAENVSNFRYKDNIKNEEDEKKYKIVKSRIVNDYHHAKDAYLNIVVGNVYYEKFTANPINFIKSGKKYSMNKVFDFTLKKGDKVIWDAEDRKTLKAVIKQVSKNDIQFTRYATVANGGFFDQMPVKAGRGQLPLKTMDDRLSQIEKYGAYNKVGSAYYFLLEHTQISKKKEERVRTIEYVPIYLAKEIEKDKKNLDIYAREVLKLVNPVILIPKIKINTLFKVDGFLMHLSGRTGDRFIVKNAFQLILSEYLYNYTQKIEKYIEKNKQQKSILPISEHQKITKEKNLELYDELLSKLENSIYNKKLSSQLDIFKNGRQKFISLNLIEQCNFLYNVFNLFDSTASTSDLTLIGGSKNAGKLLISSNIKNINQISIINQSVTGLFEQEIDLKSICGEQ